MTHDSVPMAFTPPALYVLDAGWENPAAARRTPRCPWFPEPLVIGWYWIWSV